MDASSYIRDPTKIHNSLKEVGDDLIALKELKIYIPEWYTDGPLAILESELKRICSVHAIVVEDKYYGVSKACTSQVIEPSNTNVVNFGIDKYLEFIFEPGDIVIKNVNLIRTGTFVYRIYNEFIAKGNIPWYFNNEDVCTLFETSVFHGNVNLKVDFTIFGAMGSAIARQYEDANKYHRHNLHNQNAEQREKAIYIPLNNAAYQATNVTAKLIGNYFSEGVTSALVNESSRNERIEDLLRGSFDVK